MAHRFPVCSEVAEILLRICGATASSGAGREGYNVRETLLIDYGFLPWLLFLKASPEAPLPLHLSPPARLLSL